MNVKLIVSLLLVLSMTLFACKNEEKEKSGNIKNQSAENFDTADSSISEKKQFTNDSIEAEIDSINQKVRKEINNPDHYIERAKIYQSAGDINMAVKDLDRAFRIDSLYLPTILAQADLLGKHGKFDLAVKMLERGKRHYPESSNLYEAYSELYLIAQNNQKSLKNADLAIKYDKFNANAYYLKGFNFWEIGDTNKAISSYQTAVEQNPEHFKAYLELGSIFSVKDDPLALDYYENALSIKPKNKIALYAKGMFEQEHELYNEAMQTYLKAIEYHPNFKEAYHNLGYIHLTYLKLYRQATLHFTDAIEADPEYVEAIYNRGYSFELMGDIGNAAKDYRKALSINPGYDHAAKGLSRVTEDL